MTCSMPGDLARKATGDQIQKMMVKCIRRMGNDSDLQRVAKTVDGPLLVVVGVVGEGRRAVVAHDHVADLDMQLQQAQYRQ